MARFHKKLTYAVMIAVSKIDGAVIFRREPAHAGLTCRACGARMPVARVVGVIGGADIYGYLTGGRPFEIEVKFGRDRLRPDQIRWRDLCSRLGVPWRLVSAAHEPEIAQAALDAAAWVAALAADSAISSSTSRA